jgi:hypothetical protein
MSNVHTPERQSGESFADYQARRALSNQINKANRLIGRGGVSSRKQFRDSMRESGAMGKRVRAYVALTAAWAAKVVTKAPLRDEHGAYTLVGRAPIAKHAPENIQAHMPRRKWLAGISAQRGY